MRLPFFPNRSHQPAGKRSSVKFRLATEALERREMLHGDEVLPTVVLETNLGEIPMEMFENNAPGTVDNFLTYVEDNDYINSIFHRLVPGFVLQGGGFRSSAAQICAAATCTPNDVDPGLFDAVPTDPPIVNEFDLSNLRGTVAMAKTAVSPDTATSQFFVNLDDGNAGPPASLDTQNGGFTVFAKVTDMTVVDEIAALGTINLSSLFPGSPLSAIGAAPIDGNQIARVEQISGTAVIHGTVFLDINGDSLKQANEGGIADRTVYIDANNDGMRDSREAATMTNASGEYHFRVDPGEHTIRMETPEAFHLTMTSDRFDVALDLGRSSKNRNFGLRYAGTDWTNPLNDIDVDAVNGITPRDVLLIINELALRIVSNPQNGQLPPTNTNPNNPTFFDVDGNQIVAARDAIIVINNLPGNTRASAPLSAGNTAVGLSATTDTATLDGGSSGAQQLADDDARMQSGALATHTIDGTQPTALSPTTLSDSIASGGTLAAHPDRSVDAVFAGWF
jgi:cyclophilin family peptidyl-prolyl cis-trans isomerase